MAARNACLQDWKRAFEIAVLLGAAVVTSAAAVDAARGDESRAVPAMERELIPGADRMTAAERETYRRRMALREKVVRRNDYFDPKMTPQEIEDVVAYLNATYYRFPQEQDR